MWKRAVVLLGLLLIAYYGPIATNFPCGNTAIGTYLGSCLVGGYTCGTNNWECAEVECVNGNNASI